MKNIAGILNKLRNAMAWKMGRKIVFVIDIKDYVSYVLETYMIHMAYIQ